MTRATALNSGQAALTWSQRAAETVMQRHPLLSKRWHYEPGVMLLAFQELWRQYGTAAYFDYIQRNIDAFVDESGRIRTYRMDEYNLDQINQGKLLFLLYAQTSDKRYRQAAHTLRAQLHTQPRNNQGGFWHKLRYPHQMWLDGIYMACPFYSQFAACFDEPQAFDDVALQVALIERHARDARTGLLYHAWDVTRSQRWANPDTGCSPSFWARAIGWFMMALPDMLDYFPERHAQRPAIIQTFRRTAEAVIRVQDERSGVWRQVVDQGERAGNYLEASASCMLAYALAKGVRMGYLDPGLARSARRAYQGILEQFVQVDPHGWVNLHQICSVGGLGGNPYRDGSFEYYLSEKVISNDFKGVGPFILASLEIEQDQVSRNRSTGKAEDPK